MGCEGEWGAQRLMTDLDKEQATGDLKGTGGEEVAAAFISMLQVQEIPRPPPPPSSTSVRFFSLPLDPFATSSRRLSASPKPQIPHADENPNPDASCAGCEGGDEQQQVRVDQAFERSVRGIWGIGEQFGVSSVTVIHVEFFSCTGPKFLASACECVDVLRAGRADSSFLWLSTGTRC